MRIEQEKVRAFHDRHGYPAADAPTLVDPSLAEQRSDFIDEERREYLQAVHAGDLVKVADALADLLYVVLGTCVAHGIDAQPIFDEVHRSNMTKTPLDPVTRKGGKGPGYEPPRLAPLLLLQTAPMQAISDHVVGLGEPARVLYMPPVIVRRRLVCDCGNQDEDEGSLLGPFPPCSAGCGRTMRLMEHPKP
jgi:hypothetical protein